MEEMLLENTATEAEASEAQPLSEEAAEAAAEEVREEARKEIGQEKEITRVFKLKTSSTQTRRKEARK